VKLTKIKGQILSGKKGEVVFSVIYILLKLIEMYGFKEMQPISSYI